MRIQAGWNFRKGQQAIAFRKLDPTAHLTLKHNQLTSERGILSLKPADRRGLTFADEEPSALSAALLLPLFGQQPGILGRVRPARVVCAENLVRLIR
jgi:hypothetical protein